jgi:hypothetical protein
LAFALALAVYLIVSRVINLITFPGMIVWSLWFGRHIREREARFQQTAG